MADFGFDDDEFDLDTGIDLDVDTDTVNAPEIENNGDLEFNSEQNNQIRNPKKVALIAIIIGIVLITICLGLFSLSQHFRNKDSTQGSNIDATKSTVNDIEGNRDNTYVEPDNIDTPIEKNPPIVNVEDAVNDWVQFEVAGDITFNEVVDGEFTVTSIQHFAKVVNTQNDKMVKSIVKGNISGLVGTYEVEIPYYKAVKLQLGTLLKIQYKYTVQNNVKVIGEIIFI